MIKISQNKDRRDEVFHEGVIGIQGGCRVSFMDQEHERPISLSYKVSTRMVLA